MYFKDTLNMRDSVSMLYGGPWIISLKLIWEGKKPNLKAIPQEPAINRNLFVKFFDKKWGRASEIHVCVVDA